MWATRYAAVRYSPSWVTAGTQTPPHLHFGIEDGALPYAFDSLPFVFSSFTTTGTITNPFDDIAPERLRRLDPRGLVLTATTPPPGRGYYLPEAVTLQFSCCRGAGMDERPLHGELGSRGDASACAPLRCHRIGRRGGVKLAEAVINEAGIKLQEDNASEGAGGGGKLKIVPYTVRHLSFGGIKEENVPRL